MLPIGYRGELIVVYTYSLNKYGLAEGWDEKPDWQIYIVDSYTYFPYELNRKPVSPLYHLGEIEGQTHGRNDGEGKVDG